MRAARRQGVLGVVRCGTGPSSRVRLVPLLFKILFAVAIKRPYTRFKVDKDIVDTLVHLRKKRGRGTGGSNRRRVGPSDIVLGHDLR